MKKKIFFPSTGKTLKFKFYYTIRKNSNIIEVQYSKELNIYKKKPCSANKKGVGVKIYEIRTA